MIDKSKKGFEFLVNLTKRIKIKIFKKYIRVSEGWISKARGNEFARRPLRTENGKEVEVIKILRF